MGMGISFFLGFQTIWSMTPLVFGSCISPLHALVSKALLCLCPHTPVGLVHHDALSSWNQLFDLCQPIILPGDLETEQKERKKVYLRFKVYLTVWRLIRFVLQHCQVHSVIDCTLILNYRHQERMISFITEKKKNIH